MKAFALSFLCRINFMALFLETSKVRMLSIESLLLQREEVWRVTLRNSASSCPGWHCLSTKRPVRFRKSAKIWVFPKIGGKPPKSSILIGFYLINHPFWGTTIFGNTHLVKQWSTKSYGIQKTELRHLGSQKRPGKFLETTLSDSQVATLWNKRWISGIVHR